MRMTNTGFFGPGDPIYRPGLSGLRGLGDATDGTTSSDSLLDPATLTALNSEAVFGSNLVRGWLGLAPLSVAATAPAVNVGLTQDTQNLVMLGGVAILAVILLKGKGKKRK